MTAEQVEQITAQNMETAWNVARQGGYEDVSLLATQEFEQIICFEKVNALRHSRRENCLFCACYIVLR